MNNGRVQKEAGVWLAKVKPPKPQDYGLCSKGDGPSSWDLNRKVTCLALESLAAVLRIAYGSIYIFTE